MKRLYTHIGLVNIEDIIKFSIDGNIKIGKILSIHNSLFIDESIDETNLLVYCFDETGGYKLEIPGSSIIKVITNEDHLKKDSNLEDIKKPTRYNKKGKLECWDVILDQEMNFLEGSILKYLWRYKEKNGIHDLEKAKVYIDKIIEGLKK